MDLMGDILNHVGGDPDAVLHRLQDKADGGNGSTDGRASDQAPSKAED